MDNEILLEGFVVKDDDAPLYRWFGYSVVSPNMVRAALKKANGGPLNVRINSPGGDVTSASVIYTDIRSYKGEVTMQITGMAASAASVIAMAGDVVQMSPTAEMMIHNSTLGTWGDHREMDHCRDILLSTDDAIANAYVSKTKLLTKAQIKNMMAKETWMSANEAVANGLADGVMFEDEAPGAVSKASATEPSGPLPGAREAAHNIPSAAALKERKRVWDELVPGAASLDDAKARLASAIAPPKLQPEPEPQDSDAAPTQPTEPEPSASDDSEIRLLRAQIDVLALF